MVDDRGQILTGHRHSVVEVGTLEDSSWLLRVGATDRRKSLVQSPPQERSIGVAHIVPGMARRDLQHVEGRIARESICPRHLAELFKRLGRLLAVQVGGALEEQQSQDVVLLVGDLISEEVSGSPEMVLEPAEGQGEVGLSGHGSFALIMVVGRVGPATRSLTARWPSPPGRGAVLRAG